LIANERTGDGGRRRRKEDVSGKFLWGKEKARKKTKEKKRRAASQFSRLGQLKKEGSSRMPRTKQGLSEKRERNFPEGAGERRRSSLSLTGDAWLS